MNNSTLYGDSAGSISGLLDIYSRYLSFLGVPLFNGTAGEWASLKREVILLLMQGIMTLMQHSIKGSPDSILQAGSGLSYLLQPGWFGASLIRGTSTARFGRQRRFTAYPYTGRIRSATGWKRVTGGI